MPKPLVYRDKLLGNALDPGLAGMILVGILGLGLLTAEGAILSAQGVPGVAYVLARHFRGCHRLQHRRICLLGAVRGLAVSPHGQPGLRRPRDDRLQHRDTIAQRCYALARRSIGAACACSWLAAFSACLSGSISCCIFRLAPIGMRSEACSSSTAATCCCDGRSARSGRDRCRTPAPDFLAASPADSPVFPAHSSPSGAALKGWDKARQRGVYQPFILCMQPVTLIAIYLMRPSSPVASATGLEGARLRSGRPARRLVRTAHLQTALGSAIRTRRQHAAHFVRHRPHPLRVSHTDRIAHRLRTRKSHDITRQPPTAPRLRRVRRRTTEMTGERT